MQLNTKDKEQQSANTSAKGIYNNSIKRNQPMILFDKVCKKYQNGVEAIKNLSFRIEEGEFVFLMGSSGAGKSTLIKLILMEERADDGRILVNSCNLASLKKRYIQRYRRSIGVFFQDFRLLEKKTVFQNVAFAMEITGASRKEIREKVDITLSIMGLSAKRNELPSHLSGGEQQRVALARAIVNGPDILIADEPTGNLDPENSEQIMTLLKMINARGTTVLVATHEQNLAAESGLRIIRLDHGKNISKETNKENVSAANKNEKNLMENFIREIASNEITNAKSRKYENLTQRKRNESKNKGPRFIEIKTEKAVLDSNFKESEDKENDGSILLNESEKNKIAEDVNNATSDVNNSIDAEISENLKDEVSKIDNGQAEKDSSEREDDENA